MTEKTAAEQEVAFWKSQRDQLERDARYLRWTLPITAVLTLATLPFKLPILVPVGVAALGITVAVMGKYMTFVRGQEYAAKLLELGVKPPPDTGMGFRL